MAIKKRIVCTIISILFLGCQSTPTFDDHHQYKITAAHSNKAVCVSKQGALQILSDSNDLKVLWRIIPQPDSTSVLLSVANQQVIEVIEGIEPCLLYTAIVNASPTERQLWKIIGNNNEFEFISAFNNLAIDISEIDTSDFAVINTWKQNNQPNQKWMFKKVGVDTFLVKSELHGKLLAVTPSIEEVHANVCQWNFSNQVEQLWEFKKQSDGYYSIINVHSKFALQVADGTTSLAGNIIQDNISSDTGQRWKLEKASDSTFYIRSKKTNQVLDVRDAAQFNGANVMLYDFSGDKNQQFMIQKIKSP